MVFIPPDLDFFDLVLMAFSVDLEQTVFVTLGQKAGQFADDVLKVSLEDGLMGGVTVNGPQVRFIRRFLPPEFLIRTAQGLRMTDSIREVDEVSSEPAVLGQVIVLEEAFHGYGQAERFMFLSQLVTPVVAEFP